MDAARRSLSDPRSGQRVGVVAATRTFRTRSVNCPADLIPGVLSLYPKTGSGVEPVRGRRSRVQELDYL